MKSFNCILLTIILALVSCGGKKEATHEQHDMDSDEWPVMDEFHLIMAESFHSYQDSANLDPAIANAEEMAAVAARWSGSELPEEVNTEAVRADLLELKNATAAFTEISRSGDAEKIGKELTRLHDIFHKLQEAWYSSEHDHNH